jgi:hypothetical protein
MRLLQNFVKFLPVPNSDELDAHEPYLTMTTEFKKHRGKKPTTSNVLCKCFHPRHTQSVKEK